MFEAILTPVIILSILGLAAGIMLSLAAKFMAVEVDDTVVKLREELPGANCGACGYAGCDEYAAKVAEGEAAINLCTPGGASVAAKLAEIMGVESGSVDAKKAIVRCCGTYDTSEYKMDYQGPTSCEACSIYYQGRRSCAVGCLGYGDCKNVCKFGAIKIENGLAIIDPELCTGCGACVKKCPSQLITMVPKQSTVYVACSSNDKGAQTRKVCKVGCIACMRCEKTCRFDAIHVKDNLASIDQSKCTGCEECVEVCPTKCIRITK